MREIKFRAWDRKKKEMLPDKWIQTLDLRTDGTWGIYIGGGMRRYLTGSIRGGDDCVFHDDCELMQYTGLKDKNGKEIYEGDIIKGNAKDNFVIVPMLGGLSLLNINYLSQQHNEQIAMPTNDVQTASWLNNGEVIGNIYENPKLLGKGEINERD